MLEVHRIKKLVKNPDMSDEEAGIVRDELRALAEVIFEAWTASRMRSEAGLRPESKFALTRTAISP